MTKRVLAVAGIVLGCVGIAVGQDDRCPSPGGQDEGEGGGAVVLSCDPNEMRGPDGCGEKRYVQAGEWMEYSIYFENKADASAAAQEVFVELPMDENLDWSTLELGEVAFGEHLDMGLSGKRHGVSMYALPGSARSVRTEVKIEDGRVKWYLRDWDPSTVDNFPEDPRAGFLPPNDANTHCGEGRLSYRVRVRDDAPKGAVIRASAQIVFDMNPMIETDPAWWNTVGEIKSVTLASDEGAEMNLRLVVGEPFGMLPEPEAREGLVFNGWYTGPNGTGLAATPTAIVPADVTMLYAKWSKDLGSAFTGDAAATYDGYLLDAGGAVAGTINIKTAKVKTDRKTGAKTSAVTVTVNELGQKKRTLKATLDLSTGELSYKVWPAPELAIGRDGISGSYSYGHDCTVVGARNFFTAKPAEKGDVLAKFNGRIYTVALKTEDNGGNEFADGYSTLSIAIGAKGKVKTTGVLADGTKVSVTGQLLVGANGVCCVPVLAQLYSGKSGGFGFLLKLDAADPLSAKVDALSVWNGEGAKPDSFEATWSVASAGMSGALNGGSIFNLEKVWERLNGVEPVRVLLPLNESVQTGTKWFVAKADKVKLEKSGSLTYGVNPSGLKLTYTAKTGIFKGSFSVYTLVNGKLKKVSATVNGVVVNGDGYGTATVKKVGSVPVVINGNYKEAGEDPAPVAATNDFKAQITGIAVVFDFGNYDPAKLTFMSPSTPVTVPFGHAAIFRVAYDFPEGYAAGVWLGSSWPEDESDKEYYFGYNTSAYYRGSGVAYGFITLDEEVGRACRLREAVVDTQSDPWLSSPWTIAREAVDITFEGPADESDDPEIPPSQDEEGAY